MGVQINIPASELAKRKLFIATPMYGGQCAGMFARSMADLSALCTHYKIPLQLYFLFNESLITRARNYCADEFMRSESTHLLFIDSDIGFNPRDAIGMLALQGDDSNYDVIAGPYPKKCIAWEKIKAAVEKGFADEDPNNLEKFVGDYVFNPKQGMNQIPINQPVEVLEAGTGFMMVRRKTFEKFNEAFPSLRYKPDHVRTAHFDGTREITMFFQAEIDIDHPVDYYVSTLKKIKDAEGDADKIAQITNQALEEIEKRIAASSKRYLSEDYWFCQHVQKMGLQSWFCPWIQLQHQGTYVFGGSLSDIAALGVSATADSDKIIADRNKKNKPPPPKLISKKSA